MPPQLFGKLALITGAGSGIGRAITRTLARDGATVIAADKNFEEANATLSGLLSASIALELDVSSGESVSKVLNATLEKYKRPPSIIVNSAGIVRDAYLLKMTENDFDDVYKTNLKGTFLVMQAFAHSMVQYKVGGTIINLSSIVAKLGNIGQANYAASKSGVISLTQVAAKEFGKFNIRVNAVLPGFIDTPMISSVPIEIQQALLQRCSQGRFGKPEEVAEVVSFLSSDKSSYVNGATIEVTGGLI